MDLSRFWDGVSGAAWYERARYVEGVALRAIVDGWTLEDVRRSLKRNVWMYGVGGEMRRFFEEVLKLPIGEYEFKARASEVIGLVEEGWPMEEDLGGE